MKIFQYGGRHRTIGTMWLTMWPVTWPTEANENTRVARGTLSAITVGSSNLCSGPKFRAVAPNVVADQNFSVVLDLIIWMTVLPLKRPSLVFFLLLLPWGGMEVVLCTKEKNFLWDERDRNNHPFYMESHQGIPCIIMESIIIYGILIADRHNWMNEIHD